jgi:hypothetical protein
MPTFADPYFLDGTTLSDSTAVFQNSGLTILAPDGYYSDGVIIRQQVNGLFLPQFSCPACGLACGSYLPTSGSRGYYTMQIDTGTLPTAVGAITIKYAAGQRPDGMYVEYDGVIYNELSSPYYGYLAAPPGQLTFIGQSSFNGVPGCDLVGASPHTLNEYAFNGTSFVPTGGTQVVTVTPAQLQLTPTSPDNGPTWTPAQPKEWSVIVIPKTSPTPAVMTLTSVAACQNTAFLLDISCPAKIKGINASARYETLTGICQAPLTSKLYPIRVTGVSPYLGLYDWIFLDEYGENKAADGYYRTNNLTGTNDTIQVQNGTVIAITNECP